MKKRLLLLFGICALLDWVVVRTDHYARDIRGRQRSVASHGVRILDNIREELYEK